MGKVLQDGGFDDLGFFLSSFLVTACRPESWLIWFHGWHRPWLSNSGKYTHVVEAGYQEAVRVCAYCREQGFGTSGTSLLKTFVLCLPLREPVLSYTCSGVPWPFTVPWILIDNMPICVFSCSRDCVLLCLRSTEAARAENNRICCINFPIRINGVWAPQWLWKPQYLLSLELVAGWFSWPDP